MTEIENFWETRAKILAIIVLIFSIIITILVLYIERFPCINNGYVCKPSASCTSGHEQMMCCDELFSNLIGGN